MLPKNLAQRDTFGPVHLYPALAQTPSHLPQTCAGYATAGFVEKTTLLVARSPRAQAMTVRP